MVTFLRYQKYLYFIRLKKDIVAEWKKETESKKIRHRQEVLVDEVLNIGESVEDINLADVNNSSDSQPVKTVEERLAKKDQIKKWKEDKQRKKEQEEVYAHIFNTL